MIVKEHPPSGLKAIIPIGEKLMICQPDGDDGTGVALLKVLARLVEDDSEPAGDAEFGGHINPDCVPFAAFLDQ
jgi:hypothetical protein